MRFKKINIEVSSSFWIKPFDSKGLNFEQGDLGQLRIGKRSGNLQLVVKGKLFTIEARESVRRDEIIREFGRGNENLVEISQVYRQKDWPETEVQVELSLAWFNGPAIELGNIDIALDPRTLEQASEIGLGTTFNEVSKCLFDSCNLALTDEPDENFAVAILGSEALDNLKEIEQLDLVGDAREEQQKAVIKNGLVLLGDDIQIAVQKYSGVKSDYLGVKKLVTRSHSAPSRVLRLAKLTLSFGDQYQAIATQAAHQLNKIIEEQNGYLATWDRYGASEGENLLCKARTIGRIEISPDQCQLEDGKLSIYIDQDLRDLLTPQDSIIMVSPEYSIAHLDDSDMDWKAFSEQMFNNYKASKGFDSGLSSWQSKTAKHEGEKEDESDTELADKVVSISGEPVQILSIVKVDQHRIVIKDANKPIQNMVLALSILGDQVQIERRMAARSAIVSGNSAMPHLGLLIEEEASLPVGCDQRKTLDPLSTFVENKIFPENPPTHTQKQAIKIALNTPDIVIIQGPPGTGKTTVITAIIERLNEELDKSKSLQGDILVSGYQHDAVENLLNRLSVNDLPAIKFGQRSGEGEQSSTTEIKLDEWRQQTMQRIYQHSPELKENVAYQQLERELGAYIRQPSNGAALRLVHKARVLLTGVRGSDGLVGLLKTLSVDLDSQQQDNSVLIQLLRSIRLSETAFMDDGPSRAAALLGWLNEQNIHIDAADREILQIAMSWQAEASLGFLSQLKDLKAKLLKQFTPRPQLQREMVRADVSSALSKALDLLQGNSRLAAKERALVEYLGDLEGNPRLVQDALAEYNLVYGATVQQSEGKTIRRFKSKAGDGKGYLQYGTVIVDEAARTSPRDLMIPMVQAKDRIILVGDHRQLPHIIDESILEQMEQSDSQEGREQFNQHIKESMFQYLFQRAKQLEQQDGIARTITLDAQYRSHPLLGQFASDQFYKPYGEAYSSPLPASLFSHQLEGIENKAAIWLDVPAQKGSESQNGNKSRYRTSEARVIAKQLKQWIDSEAGKGLSFGVISFYKAQVTEVMKELEKYQITERDEQGEYVITREYQMLFDGDGKAKEERLRIGTVDSFQGMEFDVVFLSMVRSQVSNSKFLKDRAYSPRDQQSVFGHLMSKNRLCVSVTRQKKALILVGDSQLAQAPIAIQAVPELQEFYRLCSTDPQGKLI